VSTVLFCDITTTLKYSAVYLATGHKVCDHVKAPTQFNVYTPIDCPSSPGSSNRNTYSQSTPGRNTCFKVSLNSPML
jgi:hypothetical protein